MHRTKCWTPRWGLEKQGDTNKRRRTTIDKGRLLTGEEWCVIIKDKEDNKRKEEDEKEQRKINILQKKEHNEREKEEKKELARSQTKGKSVRKAQNPTPVTEADSADDEAPSCLGTVSTLIGGGRPDLMLNESSHDDEQVPPTRRPVKVVDKDVCGICGGNDLLSDEESSSTIAVVVWSDCGMCHKWLHNHCIHIETTQSQLICS